jgi:5,10-methylenetetrahydrofolate reductase
MQSGHLERRLRAGEFAITTEITPAASVDPQALLDRVAPLRALVDAVNVTDGAGARAHLDTLTAAALLARAGLEPIMQLTCRDRNRIALQSMLLSAAAQGIPNLLLLRGDDPRAGDQPDAKPVFDLDALALLNTAVGVRDRAQLESRRWPLRVRPAGYAKSSLAPSFPNPSSTDWRQPRIRRRKGVVSALSSCTSSGKFPAYPAYISWHR